MPVGAATPTIPRAPAHRLAGMNPLVEPGVPLEPDRITRYSRQLMLPGFGELAQRRLRAARVLLIGAGGLGSAIAPILAGAGIGTIALADDDTVELSNLHRQLSHGVGDLGRRKVDSLADTVAATDPEVVVVRHPQRITAANLGDIIAGYDLVVDGSDNFATRYLANDAAELAGIPLVWGAILRFQGQVGVAWRGHGPTFRDLFPTSPGEDEVLSCELGGVLPSLCTAVGSLMATEVIKLITGIGEPLLGRVLFYDALTARTREIAYVADPDRDPVTELIDTAPWCATDAATGDSDGVATVSAAELLRRIRAGEAPRLLDVREPYEAEARRIPGGVLLPVGLVEAGATPDGSGGSGDAGEIIVYCEQDPRARRAARALRDRGYPVSYLVGGIRAYVAVGGEVVAGALDDGDERIAPMATAGQPPM